MTSTTSYFTKSLPKRGDITGSPNQAFNMNSTRKGYYDYILGVYYQWHHCSHWDPLP